MKNRSKGKKIKMLQHKRKQLTNKKQICKYL